MPDDAIEKISTFWRKYGSDKYAGIAALDYYMDGSVIGDPFPNQKQINIIDLCVKGKIKGDKKYVVRTVYINKSLL